MCDGQLSSACDVWVWQWHRALYTYKFCLRIVDRVQTYVLQPTNAKILNPFQEQNIYWTGDITGKYAELKSNRTQDGETREID